MPPSDELPTQRVLLIEDSAPDIALFQWLLGRSKRASWSITLETRLTPALQRLETQTFDVVVADLNLPDSLGLGSVRSLREHRSDFPLVVLTGIDDHATAVEAVRLGAQDYLVKGEFDGAVLERTLSYAVERHRLQARVLEMALVDELTGLYNRRGFQAVAAEELHRAVRRKLPIALLYFDVDHFKDVNDRFGHAEGDMALCTVAQVLKATLRASDVVARLGGDEFVALVSEADEPVVEAIRKRLQDELHRRHLDDDERPYKLELSMGFVVRPTDSRQTIEELLQAADASMYEVKQARRAAQTAA